MSSDLQLSWSGSLKSKKKNELQLICRQLAIDFKSESLKADLEQLIRKRFKEDPSLLDDQRFIKLDHIPNSPSPNASITTSSRRSARARSVSKPPRAIEDDDQSSTEDDPSRSKRSSADRKSVASTISTPSEHSPPQNILVTLVNPQQDLNQQSPPHSHSNVVEQSSQVARLTQQTSQQIRDSFDTLVQHATWVTIAVIQAIQTTFSSPWKLCVIAVLLELIFVIYSTMPLLPRVVSKSDGFSVGLPEPLVRLMHQIISKSFLRPFFEYLGLTVMVPLMIAGLMNVPNSQVQENKKFKATRDLKPSVFLFCATRLAVLALVHLVFYPNHRFGWPNQSVHLPSSPNSSALHFDDQHLSRTLLARNLHLTGLEPIQYITTAFAMAIALHQLIRSYP